MSFVPTEDPIPGDPRTCAAIQHVIVPRARDLGGFEVRRALPSAKRQMVGPFIFLDQMGPAEFLLSNGIDVRPHPHIGLATVTYLFEGEIYHRDSLGSAIAIRPGELNLMTAGGGIVHSERETTEARSRPRKLFGLQAWAALPKSHEEMAPVFAHHDASELPIVAGEGKEVRIVMGALYGARSPVGFPHPSVYADVRLEAGATLPLDPEYDERAIYIVAGEVEIAGERFAEGRLLTFRPGDRIAIRAAQPSRLVVLGGEPMDGPRHIWWNFVSSSKDRIEAAKADWMARKYPLVPGDEKEWIPLP
jgi:redox-sensitive bicupin YhaK (pirin superfamily)